MTIALRSTENPTEQARLMEVILERENMLRAFVNGNEKCTSFGKIKVYQSRIKSSLMARAAAGSGGSLRNPPDPGCPEPHG